MTRFNLCALGWLLLALMAAPRIARAAESYDNCTGTISSLPAVISTQGTWCFKQDLATSITSGDAILINTNNVTLDCNGFKLDGLGAGLGTLAYGIGAVSRFNLTVRHCSIRGFGFGVGLVGGGGGHTIEDNRFDNNTIEGIDVEGDGSVVRRNRVFNSGGATALVYAHGIESRYSVDIVDNLVSGVTARSGGGGDATGILTVNNTTGQINGNTVRGLLKDGAGTVNAIENGVSGHIVLRNNDLVGDGSAGSRGIGCAGSTQGSVRDNVISGFVTAIQTCTDSGGNDIVP